MKNPWGIVGEQTARDHVRESLKFWKDGHDFAQEHLLSMAWFGIPVWEVKLKGEVLQGLLKLAALEEGQDHEADLVFNSLGLGVQLKLRKLHIEGGWDKAMEMVRHPEIYGPVRDVLDLGWTREDELEQWIAASESSWSAYEGVKRLLLILMVQMSSDRPIPFALALWSMEVAAEVRSRPALGHRPTSETHRNRAIVRTIRDLTATPEQRKAGIKKVTQEMAFMLVAEELCLEKETVKRIWLKGKDPLTPEYVAPSQRPF